MYDHMDIAHSLTTPAWNRWIRKRKEARDKHPRKRLTCTEWMRIYAEAYHDELNGVMYEFV